LANKLNLNQRYLDYQQEIIGQWHDVIITLQLLQAEGYAEHQEYSSLSINKDHLYSLITQWSTDFDKKIIGQTE
jgi:hypothetical protein